LVRCHAGCTQEQVIGALKKLNLWKTDKAPAKPKVDKLARVIQAEDDRHQFRRGAIIQRVATVHRHDNPKAQPVDYFKGRGIDVVPRHATVVPAALLRRIEFRKSADDKVERLPPAFTNYPTIVLPIVKGDKFVGSQLTALTRDGKGNVKKDGRSVRQTRSIGPNTEGLVVAVLANRPHPEQGFRTCLGVLRLFRGLNPARAEAVAARALAIGALTYKSVASILKNNLDRAPPAAESSTVIEHQNLRGPGYFH